MLQYGFFSMIFRQRAEFKIHAKYRDSVYNNQFNELLLSLVCKFIDTSPYPKRLSIKFCCVGCGQRLSTVYVAWKGR